MLPTLHHSGLGPLGLKAISFPRRLEKFGGRMIALICWRQAILESYIVLPEQLKATPIDRW